MNCALRTELGRMASSPIVTLKTICVSLSWAAAGIAPIMLATKIIGINIFFMIINL